MEKKSKTHNLGERIKKLRLENKMTQSSLAEKLFVSDKVISKWEKGKSIPDVDILLGLSELFDISIEYILTGKTRKTKVEGERVVYKDDGSVDYYVGEDGDRLFTRNEVTTILHKRIERYQNNLFESYGVENIEELNRIISRYYYMESAFADVVNIKSDKKSADTNKKDKPSSQDFEFVKTLK